MLDLEKISDGSADLLCFGCASWSALCLDLQIPDATVSVTSATFCHQGDKWQNLRGEAIVNDVSGGLAGEGYQRDDREARWRE